MKPQPVIPAQAGIQYVDMKELILSFLKRLVGSYVDNILDLIKIEATIYYLHGVKVLRRIFIVLSLLIFLIAILAAGFVMVPVALLLFMPWAEKQRLSWQSFFAAAYILIRYFWCRRCSPRNVG